VNSGAEYCGQRMRSDHDFNRWVRYRNVAPGSFKRPSCPRLRAGIHDLGVELMAQ
jgi:hypothetical protein